VAAARHLHFERVIRLDSITSERDRLSAPRAVNRVNRQVCIVLRVRRTHVTHKEEVSDHQVVDRHRAQAGRSPSIPDTCYAPSRGCIAASTFFSSRLRAEIPRSILRTLSISNRLISIAPFNLPEDHRSARPRF